VLEIRVYLIEQERNINVGHLHAEISKNN